MSDNKNLNIKSEGQDSACDGRSRSWTGSDDIQASTSKDSEHSSSIPPNSNTGGIHSYTKRQEASADGAFIDWLNITCRSSSFSGASDEEKVDRLSDKLTRILGFGVTYERPTGLMLYQKSFVLGKNCGFVCIGGQRDTLLVALNGTGCMHAKRGWERRLYKFLPFLDRARITRADLARDFFDGEYTPDKALDDYKVGHFSLGARMPEVQQMGNWIRPSGKGRTLVVGSRESGKYARVYEKGLQLGRGFSDLFPDWVRVEGELHNKDREIPFDVLLYPGQYLAGLYPAFAFINSKQTRIKTKKNTAKIVYDAMVETAKHQFGKVLFVMHHVEGSIDAAFARVFREGIPKRLDTSFIDNPMIIPDLFASTFAGTS